MRNSPIGIFDSGIGGLTVAHALKEKLPNESIIYFDTIINDCYCGTEKYISNAFI